VTFLIIQRQITRKWYNIEYLQWPTNRKLYMIYRMAPFSMTLKDPTPSCHSLTLNILETVRDTNVVSMKY